jgi:REP element-mobilizing transposase RayT
MSYHTRISALVHYVFSTKDRLPLIPAKMQAQLWSYIGGIARTNNMKALAVGGMSDHAHVLLSLPPTITMGKAMQLIKAGSSKWMHERMGTRFEWQVGYGAFTIGISQAPATIRYILNQEKHHAKRTFGQEWKMFLERHGLELDED